MSRSSNIDISPFSVLLPVYAGDDPNHFDTAITSIAEQTLVPDEILVVRDGPVPDPLEAVIQTWQDGYEKTFRVHEIETNQGLGNALREGMRECSHEYVARMDADDVSVPDRFESQMKFLQNNPDIDVVGGYLAEFDTDPDETHAKRTVPCRHEEIEQRAKFRSPMNHATVLFRRESVMEAGNYRAVTRMEDYDLWVRMLMNGAQFWNVPEVLLKMRAGDELYDRRKGYEYARREFEQQYRWYRRGFINIAQFTFNVLTRVGIRFAPDSIRKYVYTRFRNQASN
ncbi:glycosyltransferase [Halocatena pleomorpha]|uniref:Glycosyltransferase n=1 Tax=Halocatena pleomorpha TaxID=1785090 RepID=A0A3P3RBA0_9EURY|nr:glycosyltransferase [Halocatena pleomorpha]RRJ30742.1 glycosyltransferase [Halocatena pleomorpha]